MRYHRIIMWLIMCFILRRKRKSDRWLRCQWLVHPINRGREISGHYSTLFQEYKMYPEKFYNYTRMDLQTFNHLLSMVTPYLLKNHPRALHPELRLVVALRYLTSGDQVQSIAENFRIGNVTTRNLITEVCDVLINVLQPIYLRRPTEEEWRHIAATFLEQWNIPNCVGAVDGKHVNIKAPDNSGSQFFNYKKTFSEVLFAVCDANYIFTLVHVGEMGSNSDAAIFSDCLLGQELRDGKLDLPKGSSRLPGSNIKTPCFFVEDDAFPLLMNLMKPYSGNYLNHEKTIFNYRLSRARRVIENAFGILTSRFLILRTTIGLQPFSVDLIVSACVCLHNFIRISEEADEPSERFYCPPTFSVRQDENGDSRYEEERTRVSLFSNLSTFNDLNMSEDAISMRDSLAKYFLTQEGQVPWQEEHLSYRQNLADY